MRRFTKITEPRIGGQERLNKSRRHVILDLPTKEAIVIARYGALQVGLEPQVPIREIAKYFYIPYATVQLVLHMFRTYGHVQKRKRGRNKKEVPALIKQSLLNPYVLDRWATFTIK